MEGNGRGSVELVQCLVVFLGATGEDGEKYLDMLSVRTDGFYRDSNQVLLKFQKHVNFPGEVKLFLFLIKQHAMKTNVGTEVKLHTILNFDTGLRRTVSFPAL
jgi:hypothetical protein